MKENDYIPNCSIEYKDYTHLHFNEIDSTNSWAKIHCSEFHRTKVTLVTAQQQTAARGRYKNRWYSPAGNVCATFCFFLKKNDNNNIAQVIALAVAQTFQKLGFQPKLKWPNDILIDDKKVSGVLCEVVNVDDMSCYLVGIGINVNMSDDDLRLIDKPATSLRAVCGKEIDIETLIKQLTDSVIKAIRIFEKEGFQPFVKAFKELNNWYIGKQISFRNGERRWEGKCLELDDLGALTLALASGERRTITSGEIIFEP